MPQKVGALFRTSLILPRPALLACAALLLLAHAGCEGELDIVHGLDEYEANHILVVLESQGFRASKLKEEGRIPTWAVLVSEGQSMEALRVLVANRLPKPRSSGLAQVYPAGSGGLIPTKTEEKAKFLLALQGEVENMLKVLPGVQDARVSVVVPEKDVVRDLDTPPPPATASVAVVYNPDGDGNKPIEEAAIRELVAAAVEDLKPEFVRVVMKENRLPVLISPDGVAGDDGAPPAAGETVLGIKVVDQKAGTRAKMTLGLFTVLAVIGVVLGIAGIVRAVSLKSKLSRSEAELASIKKARREQT